MSNLTSLPKGWTRCAIGEACEVNPGRPALTEIEPGTAVTFVGMSAVDAQTGTITNSVVRPLTEVRKGYTTFEQGDVIVAKITPCMENGKAAVVGPLQNRLGFGSTEFHVLRPIGLASAAYLYHYVRQEFFRRAAAGNMTGSVGQKRVPASFIAEAKIEIAPLAEQHRIVAEIEQQFTRLDAAMAALERVRANLKRYRAAVLAVACEGRLVPTEADLARREGREFEPGAELLRRVLTERGSALSVQPDETGLSTVPEGWARASTDALMIRITSGSRDWSRYYGAGMGTFLMAQNVRPGRLDLSFRQPVNPPDGNRDRDRSLVHCGDILVTIVGANTGDVCRVPSHLREHYVCQSVALMRPALDETSPFISWYLVSDENGRRQYDRYIYGAGRPHLSFDQLRMTAIALPPLAEQHRIVAEVERRLSFVEKLEAVVSDAERRAAALRQSILKRAFEGKLVPQDPNDEPASVLLERIRAERAAAATNGAPKRAARKQARA